MRELTYREAINETLRQALARDSKVFVMGEDIGVFGGIYAVTTGLMAEFGEERVIDTPIAEVVMAGIGAGAAMTGMRPIVEIENMDWITLAMDGIINSAAKLRYMSGGSVRVPLVIRTPQGAGRGGAAQHSQSFHALFMNIPGLKIAVPSTPYDAKGLLNTAIEDENTVLYIEHRMLYAVKGDVPEEYYKIPFGEAAVRKEGKDVTIVATQRMAVKALTAAEELASEGIDIEVIDPRTLCPLDKATILDSVKKTGRLITVDEGCKTNGVGSEIAAIIAEEAIDYLEAPIIRLAPPMVVIPYSRLLENLYLPDENKIKEAINQVLKY
ncbi:MAG: alpha-ketoacid dehydrogenase subunit beta [Dehalococcoidia bacterium]|nr:alpha-ketoacid dehydrogenase subunit beta [Dehalococcoidia bacterium]